MHTQDSSPIIVNETPGSTEPATAPSASTATTTAAESSDVARPAIATTHIIRDTRSTEWQEQRYRGKKHNQCQHCSSHILPNLAGYGNAERTGNNIRKICDHRMPIMRRRRQYHTAKNLTPRTCSCETYRVDQCGRAYGSGRQRNQQQRRSMGAYKHQEHKERQHQRQQQLRFGRDDGNKAQCRKRRRPARKPAD